MIELKQALNDTWFFFRNNIYWISLIVLPIVIPVEILNAVMTWFIDDEDTLTSSDWMPGVVDIILYPIHQGALIIFLINSLSGEKHTLKQYYQYSFRYWGRLFLLYVIIGIAFGVGLFLLILPGLIVLARVAFSEFYCLFDNRPAIESFSKSWNVTRESQWLLIKGVVVIYVLTMTPFVVLSYVADAFELWGPVLSVVTGSVYSILLTLITIFYFRVYTSDPERLDKLSGRESPG